VAKGEEFSLKNTWGEKVHVNQKGKERVGVVGGLALVTAFGGTRRWWESRVTGGGKGLGGLRAEKIPHKKIWTFFAQSCGLAGKKKTTRYMGTLVLW